MTISTQAEQVAEPRNRKLPLFVLIRYLCQWVWSYTSKAISNSINIAKRNCAPSLCSSSL